MLLRNFYTEVASSEIRCALFLECHGLIPAASTETRPCPKCGSSMRETTRKTRNGESYPTLRCGRKGCQTTSSIRTGNGFLAYVDSNGRRYCRLTLCEITEIVMLWSIEMPLSTISQATGRSMNTVVDWANFCRSVCSKIVSVDNRGKMIGSEDEPIQIDEARFAGRRKYKKGGCWSEIGQP